MIDEVYLKYSDSVAASKTCGEVMWVGDIFHHDGNTFLSFCKDIFQFFYSLAGPEVISVFRIYLIH